MVRCKMSVYKMLLVTCVFLHLVQLSITINSAELDNIATYYPDVERDFWNKINTLKQVDESDAMTEVVFHPKLPVNPDLNQWKIEPVQLVNGRLAELISDINGTQNRAHQLYLDRNFTTMKEFASSRADFMIDKVTKIFAETNKAQFIEYIRANSDRCQTSYATQENNGIFELYNVIAASVINGFMLGQSFHMIMAIKNTGESYHYVANVFRDFFVRKYEIFRSSVRNITAAPPEVIWNCDNYKENDTYTQITNFLQGYIDSEVNLNAEGSCTGTCSDYRLTENYGCKPNTYCDINYLDRNKTRCDGAVRDCQFIESDMKLCPNENDDEITRRYNYAHYSSGLVLGNLQFCPYETKVESWQRFLVRCSYCFCYCDSYNQRSDRYFSLREANSNIFENKMVNGIRFVKKNRTIHLAVHQADPLTASYNNDAIFDWTSDQDFFLEDFYVRENVDYFRLTPESRSIDLNEIRVEKGQVVTGARLAVTDGHLRLEIRGTVFNSKSGTLSRDPNDSKWYKAPRYVHSKLPIENVDVPTKSPESSVRHRNQNIFVEFTPTDIYKDMAQTTVPFIETTPVLYKNWTALSGAGLYYKSRPGYGGFIGIFLIPFRYF